MLSTMLSSFKTSALTASQGNSSADEEKKDPKTLSATSDTCKFSSDFNPLRSPPISVVLEGLEVKFL